MSMVDAGLLLAASFFSLYALACALECGIGLSLLGLGGDSARAQSLFTPFWEVTNVFLVFGFTTLGVLFNSSLQTISHALLSTLAVGLISLLLRACIVLKIFYVNAGRPKRLEILLFSICNFVIPLSFTAAGAYLVTGQLFWHTLLGWLIMLAAFLGLTAIGLLSVERIKKQSLGNLAYVLWLLVLGCLLPLTIAHTNKGLQQWPIALLALLSFAGLLALLLNFIARMRLLLLATTVIVGLSAPLLLAWANRPYLINGQLTLANAYGAQAFGSVVIIGLIVTLPVILLGGWLFYKLIKTPLSI